MYIKHIFFIYNTLKWNGIAFQIRSVNKLEKYQAKFDDFNYAQ